MILPKTNDLQIDYARQLVLSVTWKNDTNFCFKKKRAQVEESRAYLGDGLCLVDGSEIALYKHLPVG